MRIVSLAISNIMKVKAAFIQPTTDIVMVQGDNEAGKSSVLDAIVFGLKSGRSLPEKPITTGADKGSIVMEIAGSDTVPPFTITQSISAKGANLSIKPTVALKGQTPRAFLDSIIGSVSFDPLHFINQDEKKQLEVLREMLGLDTTDIDAEEKDLFAERTERGRDVKEAEARFKDTARYDIEETEELSVVTLSEEMTEAIAFNRNITDRVMANAGIKSKAIEVRDSAIPAKEDEIERLEYRLKCEKENLSCLVQDLDKYRTEFKEEKAVIAEIKLADVDAITEKIKNVEQINTKVRANIEYVKAEDHVDEMTIQYNNIDTMLSETRQKKVDLLASVDMPVPGLTFSGDSLLYDNLPLAQASDGRKLMISLGISMALNPTLRILRIKDGSLLGKKNLKILADTVKDKDYQLWVEKVNDKEGYDSSGQVGIFIEGGEVKSVDGKKPTKKKAQSKKKKAPAKKEVEKKEVEDKKETIETEDDDW